MFIHLKTSKTIVELKTFLRSIVCNSSVRSYNLGKCVVEELYFSYWMFHKELHYFEMKELRSGDDKGMKQEVCVLGEPKKSDTEVQN